MKFLMAIAVDGRKWGDIVSENQNVVKLGSHVVVSDLETKQEITFRIVSASEANVKGGKVSDVSPLGQTLIGKTPGALVDVKTPAGTKSYKVMIVL